ncbi:DEAD/DEAH box helicase [Clostridium perfringens]|uniref:DEAD/DEAH box helicase n=2 Tax=Clostridium perfringens TaxID=1502 RepID=UPI001C87D750|nr:DEAD/DEAH box helicase [Clostridium perfringens]MDB2042779.1 DEAD/DEAH box helicase [Clostridium perfringens]MDB2055268.1 DEAD/DEAH box helicase [Clostridium perfringens]MDM0662689.1 DEAD/DEAH box helicase [Clostridium perfringens]MDM0677550.1 DEAD/DEAH box helicase [Clostridium perfringens]MDM0680530.1 DEAD/DEAH box helicase [Clostridium perfringens]
MNNFINSNKELVNSVNNILKKKRNCSVNIVNDKLTLSVFSLLEKNLSNVKDINFLIRNTSSIPSSREISREFQIDINPNNMLFNSYDIIEKNKLKYFAKAKAMYDFIDKNVNVRRVNPKIKVKSNLLTINNDFMIQGSSSLELSIDDSKSKVREINFNTIMNDSMDKSQICGANEIFNKIWYGENMTIDFKKELMESLNYVYKEHSPEFLYYFTLNELFGNQLDYGVERFERDNTSFKKTKIWNMLFDFQKDAVLSAIQKINKYNGCIIADSVGLGKTFEALAVIKYFELRQDNVLVLTPAKLYDNWNSYRGAYKDSILDEVFNYKIMFHTDLSRTSGESKSGWDLSRFDWSKFDLVVIDESHNFRNRREKEDGFTRYQRLLEEVSKSGCNTKFLLLSATPVNNSLNDLKNQLSIITGDRDLAFKEEGISSVENVLRKTSQQLNIWEKQKIKNKEDLFNNLPSDFYKLLEMITIARSRKHITNYYGTEKIGKFPEKLKPKTFNPTIDKYGELLNFEKTNKILESLNLSVYAPLSYIKGEYKEEYARKYQSVRADGKVLMTTDVRESGMKVLHRFNLFKRLESSVFSFGETIRRLLEKIDNCIDIVEENGKNLEVSENEDNDEYESDSILNYKYEIKVDHLNKDYFLNDLYYDKEVLERLYADIIKILETDRDKKLETLLEFLKDKVKNEPYNKGNKKVLIFSAFADTTNYIYEKISNEMLKLGVYTGLVTGSGKPRTNNKNVKAEFNNLLCAFSPKSKVKSEISRKNQIDILIGTDCISEGQNLQDCDTVINFDINWNPVALIQRMGRIDRIGSENENIMMVNFFPALELNEYLSLEKRVKGKMNISNIVSTGDDDLLSPEMNDINFRKKQLERLKEEIIDIDEANDSISLTDLNMNDYLYELSEYIKKEPKVKKVPRGIFSITNGEYGGAIFCFKHKNDLSKPENDSSLYPYYLVYVDNDGNSVYEKNGTRNVLKEFRKLCYKKSNPDKKLFEEFSEETNNAHDMSTYSDLLNEAIDNIQGIEEENSEQTIFDFGGFNNFFEDESSDDFELVSFLVVK